MDIKQEFGKKFYELTPRSPFMGPPLPEGFDVWWPNLMLAARPGLITNLNLHFLKAKRTIANAIAGQEVVPAEPYPHKVW